ncbi:ornithine carbamoyltransferase [Variovorax sp. HW608]|nr:ornithine carbamoyltransferase [Variovorax sp. HW608]
MTSASRIASLIATADQLRQSSAAPLRGKNLALLRAKGAPRASQLQHAAEALGARVALLDFAPQDGSADASSELITLARMLGRMYDAIDCDDLGASAQRLIALHAGVPVFPGLALDTHPARVIADLWTLCERQAPAGRRIVFVGNGRSRRAQMFVTAARTMGIAILMKSLADAGGEGTPAIADASRASHWILWIGGVAIDRDAMQESHRRIMQAVLVHTLLGA